MSHRALSPMVDSPQHPTNGDRRSYVEKIAKLEYENSALKTEKRLLDQSKESMRNRYEDLLKKKNDEINGLQANFDFVFNQRKQLQSKLENHQDVAGKHSKDSSCETAALKKEVRSLTSQIDKLQRHYNGVSGKAEHLRLDLNRELAANDQYRERVAAFEKEVKRLKSLNDDLVDRLEQARSSSTNGIAASRVSDVQLKYDALQKTNRSLQTKVDSLLQHKISVELLKQKNATLASRIERLEDAEKRAFASEAARLDLETRFNEYFGFLSQNIVNESDSTGQADHTEPTQDDRVLNFVKNYKSLQNRNLVLYDKLNETLSRLAEAEGNQESLLVKIRDELSPQIASLQAAIDQKDTEIKELQKTKLLNRREIDFLRNSLKDMDKVVSTKQQDPLKEAAAPEVPEGAQPSLNADATNRYLTNLEKLVDDYKKEIDNLRTQTRTQETSAASAVPSKRPRLVEDVDITVSVKNTQNLRNENIRLLAELKGLKDELDLLRNRINAYEKAKASQSPQILEFRRNPFNKDQLIKQETLDVLRKENEALLQKYVRDGIFEDPDEQVPKAVFARQENDKDNLQARIDQLNKKINRLNTVYAEKSKKIMSLIARYFGYSVEFVPSPMNPNDFCSKIKFFSRTYALSHKDSDIPYLTVDVHTKDLKAHGNYDFRTLCAGLVDQWVNEKDLIPCFLSALNLRLHQEAAENKTQ